MNATKYTYSIQDDFPNHKVAPDRLDQEIRSSDVTIALDHIYTSGDDCDIWFKDELPAEDVGILNGIVAVHSGEPLAPAPELVTIDGAAYDEDGKEVVVPTPAPMHSYTWYTSNGDVLDPVTRGEGTAARITYNAAETGVKSVELTFAESVYIHDGEISWDPVAEFDGTDHFSVYIKFDQTDITPNPGGTGNCNLVSGYLIVPAAGDGAYDVSLTDAVPLPDTSGPWTIDEKTEDISIYTSDEDLGRYERRALLLTGVTPPPLYLVRNVNMGSPRGVFEIDAYLVEWASRHWKLGLEMHKAKSPSAAVEMNGLIMMFRWNATANGAI